MAARKNPRRKKAVELEAAPLADVGVPQLAEVADEPQSAPEAVSAPISATAADEAGGAVALASNCTVKDATALKQSLVALKDLPQPVVIDASAVERVDTATLQLLCAFVRDRMGRDREVSWHSPSSALREASGLLGVTELLCLPAEAA